MRKTLFTLVLTCVWTAEANAGHEQWYNSEKWDLVGDATLHSDNRRRLVGTPGEGVLINGTDGKRPSLVTKRRDYRDVEVHLEFMVARDFTGWHTSPLVTQYWSIENGVLKSHGLLREWGACLTTKKHYRDFILMLDFRMPTISDSGVNFRRLIPEIPGFGDMEQFNLRSRGGMGHLESYYFLPKETARKMGLQEEEKPHIRHVDPEVGLWHTVKLTMKGRTFSAEYDGRVLLDRFRYHDWMISMEPAPIRLQKHIVVHGQNLGKENPCPIEYRNIFIKEIEDSP